MKKIASDLIKIADLLDSSGFYKEAAELDLIADSLSSGEKNKADDSILDAIKEQLEDSFDLIKTDPKEALDSATKAMSKLSGISSSADHAQIASLRRRAQDIIDTSKDTIEFHKNLSQ